MERFPLHLIREPTAFTNSNPGELYNNIFAFIVHPVEMHIFQVKFSLEMQNSKRIKWLNGYDWCSVSTYLRQTWWKT